MTYLCDKLLTGFFICINKGITMSSLNDYIRFALDIEDHNIVFKDYFYKILNGTKYKIYEAELIQPACPFCGSVSLIHNGHL